ncbi:ABC transporter permease [Lacrimispora sp. 210928-DFI.3.58]|uniref:ABC transporter permease n=1 Tax=Lacrimispora sp. 210928-DFI.3.58 TaxID=2883214 RepID=UPI001D07A381|nr:ABC transporter permease [Lacrimispora sp. 210928-DFI.3.58]MCB7320358.1 ABC transporter permease [Lacrimispora sp. 210928-DFI.3.58]
MIKYVVKRFVQMIVVLFIVSVLVFLLTNFIGDPVDMLVPENATLEQIESARARLGLDKPLPVQYGIFLNDVLHGNLGKSYTYGLPAMSLIVERMPATLELVAVAATLVLLVSIPLGVYAGAYPKRKTSKLIMSGSILGISLPSFWLGMMMIYIFAVVLRVLPASGRGEPVDVLGVKLSLFAPGGIRYIILPAVTLALTNLATMLRLTRSGILENMRQDYIKFARAKGVPAKSILFGHALKNALIPVITVFGLDLGNMIAFTTITETIFAWPGMGKLLIDAINKADRPIIVAYLMAASCMFVVLNFIVDILYTLVDPRIELR